MDAIKFKESTSLDLAGFSEVTNLDVADKRELVKQIPVAIQFITTLMKIHRMSQEEAETIFSKESLYYRK